MKFISPVQIRAGKGSDELLFQSKKIKFEYQFSRSCYYLDKSNIVVLLTPCFRETYYDLFYVLIDFDKKQFSILNAPNFDLKETSEREVRLELNFRYSYDQNTQDEISKDDGKFIGLDNLKWYNINRIDRLCSLV